MGWLIALAIFLVVLYFWILGRWFAWVVGGGFFAFTCQMWMPLFGWKEVEPASNDLWIRMLVIMLIAGIPFFLREALNGWIHFMVYNHQRDVRRAIELDNQTKSSGSKAPQPTYPLDWTRMLHDEARRRDISSP